MPPTECADEHKTQHYLCNGYGPVKSEERVVVAVFQKTECDGDRLAPTAFKAKDLVRGEFSMARAAYISRAEFETKVVTPQSALQGTFVGIVRAEVGTLRGLRFAFEGSSYRAVCVTDKVTLHDYDAHGALGYSESQKTLNLNEKEKRMIRLAIHADLADSFGNILAIDHVFVATGESP